MKLTEHFTQEEMQCHCGCNSCGMDAQFMEKLESARVLSGIPFRINSAFRCLEYNSSVGGVDSSSHTSGKAVDIACRDSRSRWLIVDGARQAGFYRIGIDKTFIHLDADSEKSPMVVWLY